MKKQIRNKLHITKVFFPLRSSVTLCALAYVFNDYSGQQTLLKQSPWLCLYKNAHMPFYPSTIHQYLTKCLHEAVIMLTDYTLLRKKYKDI